MKKQIKIIILIIALAILSACGDKPTITNTVSQTQPTQVPTTTSEAEVTTVDEVKHTFKFEIMPDEIIFDRYNADGSKKESFTINKTEKITNVITNLNLIEYQDLDNYEDNTLFKIILIFSENEIKIIDDTSFIYNNEAFIIVSGNFLFLDSYNASNADSINHGGNLPWV